MTSTIFSLSVLQSNKEVKHYRITENNEGRYLVYDTITFEDLKELVEYYLRSDCPPGRLREPCRGSADPLVRWFVFVVNIYTAVRLDMMTRRIMLSIIGKTMVISDDNTDHSADDDNDNFRCTSGALPLLWPWTGKDCPWTSPPPPNTFHTRGMHSSSFYLSTPRAKAQRLA